MDTKKPTLINGGIAVDDRGALSFINEAEAALKNVKRFYIVENFSLDTLRAYHGHLKEAKIAYPVSGSAIIICVKFGDPKNPDKNAPLEKFVLSSKKPTLLYIPPGYANGIKFLELGTKMLFFSTFTIEDAKSDDYRFPADFWGEEIWKVESR